MTNIVILSGRISSEIHHTAADGKKAFTSFTLVTEKPKLKDGKPVFNPANGYKETYSTFHSIVCYNGMAGAVANHKKKGDKLLVEGEIRNTKWTDSNGNDRYGTEIVAHDIEFL
jgi:single-strand DNA-binding protein